MTCLYCLRTFCIQVIDAKKGFLDRLAIQVVADFYGDAAMGGPGGEVQAEGLSQIGQILLPKPFEIGYIASSL